MNKRFVMILIAAAALLAGAAALAQAVGDSSNQQTLSELRQRAQRLTLLADVPAEARSEAAALLDRVDALRAASEEREIARLQAYIAALESGDSPAVAEQVASSQVTDANVELARQREALSADVQAFVAANPGVSSALRAHLSGNIVVTRGTSTGLGSVRMIELGRGNGRISVRSLGPDGSSGHPQLRSLPGILGR